ncbi:MAG TPA: tyrosine-type recombinase/integrase [Vicinamibacteria bacterium]|nr:tyrosine-type recombinase/integrase [Vicinamibacteria bacterium]
MVISQRETWWADLPAPAGSAAPSPCTARPVVLDLTACLRFPRLQHLPRSLPEAEVVWLMESGPGSHNAVRDRAILELLYGTGLRASEVARLGVEDVCFSERVILVRQGKRGKDRLVPMGEHLAAALQAHLAGRARLPGRLFLTQAGQPLGRGTLGSMLRRAARRAGLDRPVSPHRLRHRHATHLLRNGAPILVIKSLLGHETPLSTGVHLEVEVDDLGRMLRRSHPRERGKQ